MDFKMTFPDQPADMLGVQELEDPQSPLAHSPLADSRELVDLVLIRLVQGLLLHTAGVGGLLPGASMSEELGDQQCALGPDFPFQGSEPTQGVHQLDGSPVSRCASQFPHPVQGFAQNSGPERKLETVPVGVRALVKV
ncbi:hypothetical protein [Streptomyces sp. NPDC051572]|uniref:hypothetical protein n=1 Tax=Streptomyces sp. NPDC051572 TaxID=3155802 RepID=UPI00344B0D6E